MISLLSTILNDEQKKKRKKKISFHFKTKTHAHKYEYSHWLRCEFDTLYKIRSSI